MRKGFTLVELSIVLVIIGLLIGGILTGQSMINTAKISAEVRQIGQFDAGVMSFKAKYNFLPGDAPALGGDGNGILAVPLYLGAGYDIQTFVCETGNFWHDFDPVQFPGIAPCAQPGARPSIDGIDKNVPESKLGRPRSFVIASALSIDGYSADTSDPRNFYVFLGPTIAQSLSWAGYYSFDATTSNNSSVRPVDLLALDKKIDDGIANAGTVLSGAIAVRGCCTWGAPVAVPLATCSSGPNYDLTHDSYECTPMIRIGVSVGAPQ